MKSSISHEAEPSGIWMTEGGQQAASHFPTGRNEFITCSYMVRAVPFKSVGGGGGGGVGTEFFF